MGIMALSPGAKTSFIAALEADLGESLPSSFVEGGAFVWSCTRKRSSTTMAPVLGVFLYRPFLGIKLIQSFPLKNLSGLLREFVPFFERILHKGIHHILRTPETHVHPNITIFLRKRIAALRSISSEPSERGRPGRRFWT